MERGSMSEIICPHCDKAFKVDETGYTNIIAQVRDTEFEKSLSERVNQVEKDKNSELKLVEKQSESALLTVTAEKNMEIERLRSQIKESQTSMQLAVSQAVKEIEKDRDNLKNDLKNAQLEKQNSENLLRDKYKTQIRDRDDARERLNDMKAKLST